MPTKAQQSQAAQETKRIGDYVAEMGGQQFEGEKIKSELILGEDVKLLDFAVLPSKLSEEVDPATGQKVKKNFLVLQIEVKGKVCVTTTGAAQVVARIEQMPKQYLPVMIKIVKAVNPENKRTYYTVE